MAYWGSGVSYVTKTNAPIKMGNGENTNLSPFDIDKSESSYSRNTSSRNYPALSVRPGRVASYGTGTTPLINAHAFGLRADSSEYPHALVYNDATSSFDWKRWGGTSWVDVKTGLGSGSLYLGKFIEFNTEAKRYTVLVNGKSDVSSWDGTTAANIAGAPLTHLYTVDDYRLYALVDSVIKCSAAGSVTDWTTAGDADSIAITGMVGRGSALATYNDQVIAWSRRTMHILYGDDPDNFTLSDPINCGCIARDSVITHNGILYFLDYGKYMAYQSGMPVEISQKVKKYLENIDQPLFGVYPAAGSVGRYIYLSIPLYPAGITNNLTLEYDTERGTWYVIDAGFESFVNIGEDLYGLTRADDNESCSIQKINSGTTNNGVAIEWSHITGVWSEGTIAQKKTVSDLWLTVDLPVGSTLTIAYSNTVDGEDFTTLYTATSSSLEQNFRVQIPTTALQNFDWYRLKFSGTGPCTIYGLESNFRVKAR